MKTYFYQIIITSLEPDKAPQRRKFTGTLDVWADDSPAMMTRRITALAIDNRNKWKPWLSGCKYITDSISWEEADPKLLVKKSKQAIS